MKDRMKLGRQRVLLVSHKFTGTVLYWNQSLQSILVSDVGCFFWVLS